MFLHPGIPMAEQVPARTGFDFPATLRGSTAHFNVYYDPALGANGPAIADGILATCEQEYATISAWFGGITPGGLPMNILLASGIGGAYHYGCAATDIYVDADTSPTPDIDHSRMLVVAEEVEVFSAAQGAGWDCGASNGEGLSRVLATELYAGELDGFASAASWLDTPDRPNFVDNNDPTDRNYVSIGCSVLFLYYLRYQLGFDWTAIVAAAGNTLAGTYTQLTGLTDGWAEFTSLVQKRYPIGTPSGVTGDNIFPILRGLSSGYMVQSTFGQMGNFELILPSPMNGLDHYWRDNDDPNLPWYGAFSFGRDVGRVDDVCLIQSNFGLPGNLEVIARVADQLYFFWRDSGPGFVWSDFTPLTGGVRGNPALIQSRFGVKGNFELVVPAAGGGLLHFWRDNDDPSLPWYGPTAFGSELGIVDSVALIQSNFGFPGDLEVVARVGSQLYHLTRDSGPAFAWSQAIPIPGASGMTGIPGLIQGRFGNQGNFELVCPLANGGIAYLWRDNDNPSLPWTGPQQFGSDQVFGTTLIESNFGTADLGNLELPARACEHVIYYWREDQPPWTWFEA